MNWNKKQWKSIVILYIALVICVPLLINVFFKISLQIKSQAEIDESMYFFIQTVLLVQKPDHLMLVWNA